MNGPTTMPLSHIGLYPGRARTFRAIRQLRTQIAIISIGVIVLFAGLLLSTQARAQQLTVSPAWTVVQVSGEARVRPTGQDQPQIPWQTLTPGAQVSVASETETGPNGLVRLTRGEDVIRIMPASRLAIPPRPAASIFTRIRVLLGKAFFDVDKRAGEEFEVQTPYLAAIVKGTSFSVSVTGERSRVNVAEGLVGVTALGNGQSVNIGPGQSARVTSQPNAGVSTETLAPVSYTHLTLPTNREV